MQYNNYFYFAMALLKITFVLISLITAWTDIVKLNSVHFFGGDLLSEACPDAKAVLELCYKYCGGNIIVSYWKQTNTCYVKDITQVQKVEMTATVAAYFDLPLVNGYL